MHAPGKWQFGNPGGLNILVPVVKKKNIFLFNIINNFEMYSST